MIIIWDNMMHNDVTIYNFIELSMKYLAAFVASIILDARVFFIVCPLEINRVVFCEIR